MKFTSQILKSQKGIALLMAVSAISLILLLVMEVTYESMVEYTLNSQNLNRIQAYYAAKSGVDLSLLRIKTYNRIKSQLGKNAGPYEKYLNMIWQYPLGWPLPTPEELNGVDRSSYDEAKKESLMEASFVATIQDEGSKIDINDLASKSESLRKSTAAKLLQILNQSLENNDKLRNKYTSSDFEEIIHSMTDWMSTKSESAAGGSKKARFQDLSSSAPMTDLYPPNRPFRTLYEIKMIPKMNDEIFEILKDQITIYGMKGINPNTASAEILKGLDAAITDEVVQEIKKERENQPFTSAQAFWTFLEGIGVRLQIDKEDIDIQTDQVHNFTISSIGVSGGSTREITAIVVDLDAMATQIKTALDKDKKNSSSGSSGSETTSNPSTDNPSTGAATTPTTATSTPPQSLPKGPPRILYWNER